jgi:uncharacterized protein YhdP
VAAGLVAQAVLDKPLKDSSIIYYEITGPWSKPEVRRLPTEPVTADKRTQ